MAEHSGKDLVLGDEVVVGVVSTPDLVHAFETDTLGLGNEKPCPDRGKDGEDAKENEGAVSCSANERRGDEANDEVVEPVCVSLSLEMS